MCSKTDFAKDFPDLLFRITNSRLYVFSTKAPAALASPAVVAAAAPAAASERPAAPRHEGPAAPASADQIQTRIFLYGT